MIGDRTYRYMRQTFGTLQQKNIYSVSFGFTATRKIVSNASATAILAATAAPSSGNASTVTSGITNPDVPRCLSVTPGGTSANILGTGIIITGTNIEGKTITEIFRPTAGATTVVNGTKAFKTVTSIQIPPQAGSGVTFSVGTRNILGVNHRLFKNNTTVKVFSATSKGIGKDTLTMQAQPTVTASEDQLELNTVQPATSPDGTTFLIIAYVFDNWATDPFQDEPEYSTSTSTSSTSSSTSTTTGTTTSTSSTSSSTSSTSSSTSSTSSSTSSTSTSTTTVP